MSSGRNDRRRARNEAQEAKSTWQNLDLPSIDEQKLFLEMLQQQGEYTPEMEAYLGDIASEVENLDPRLRNEQLQSLDALRAIAEQGGYTDSDKAAMRLYQRDAAAYDQAKQNQILQQMEQQGMGSSGNRLVSQLMSAQAAADRLGRSGDEQLANALNRELQAQTQAASLAGNIGQQDLARAGQMDAISQFNRQNQQALNQRNVANRNQAQQANLAEKQRVADSNVGLRNQQQQHNTGLLQQDFNNRLAKTQGLTGQNMANANMYQQQAANSGAATGNLINTGVRLGAAYYTGGLSEAANKKPGEK